MHLKMENKILKAIILILTALFGGVITEVTDDKIEIPILEKPEVETPAVQCVDAIILGYTCDGKKHICECVGDKCPCVSTEEILSSLG